jgi:hypothetical protein
VWRVISSTSTPQEKIAKLGEEMQRLADLEAQMLASPDQQISLTDPDARSMATSGRGSGVVGYTVPVAVETEYHLIVAHEVTNDGCDRAQLAAMSQEAKAVLEVDQLDAVADRGSLMKTLPKVRGEMALHVLAYNLTRVLNILGIPPLMAALRA